MIWVYNLFRIPMVQNFAKDKQCAQYIQKILHVLLNNLQIPLFTIVYDYEWKINIFKIIDTRISFYSRNTHLLPPKPKSSFRHLKRGIQDFHMNYVLVPADKAANNVVVV